MPLVSWDDLSALGFDLGKSYHHLVSEIFTLSPNRQMGTYWQTKCSLDF